MVRQDSPVASSLLQTKTWRPSWALNLCVWKTLLGSLPSCRIPFPTRVTCFCVCVCVRGRLVLLCFYLFTLIIKHMLLLELSLVAGSRDYSSIGTQDSHCGAFSCYWPPGSRGLRLQELQHMSFSSCGCSLSCFSACIFFPDHNQTYVPCTGKAESYPGHHQGSSPLLICIS